MSELIWNKVFALEQTGGDEELLQELLDIFKDSLLSDISIIEQGMVESSSDKVCSAAHSIKGAAVSLGFSGIQDVAFNIEMDSRAGGLETAKENFPVLKNCLLELQRL